MTPGSLFLVRFSNSLCVWQRLCSVFSWTVELFSAFHSLSFSSLHVVGFCVYVLLTVFQWFGSHNNWEWKKNTHNETNRQMRNILSVLWFDFFFVEALAISRLLFHPWHMHRIFRFFLRMIKKRVQFIQMTICSNDKKMCVNWIGTATSLERSLWKEGQIASSEFDALSYPVRRVRIDYLKHCYNLIGRNDQRFTYSRTRPPSNGLFSSLHLPPHFYYEWSLHNSAHISILRKMGNK